MEIKVPKYPENVVITQADMNNVDDIVELINEESRRSGAVGRVSHDTVADWIKNGVSAIAVHKGRIIGHRASHFISEIEWAEQRAAVIKPEFRRKGIGYRLAVRSIDACIEKYPGVTTFLSIVLENGSGLGILRELGFVEIDPSCLPEIFRRDRSAIRAFKLDRCRYKSAPNKNKEGSDY